MPYFKKESGCCIVAEISANHGQDLNRAVSMIKKAAECGVSAVKFQAYTSDTLTINIANKYFRIKHPKWGGQTLYQLYSKAYTPWSWFKKLKKTADDLGLVFFATAFDKTSIDFLEELKVPIHKVASFELVDLELIRYAASTGKPIVLSTGMATFSEIKDAVKAAKRGGAKDITLLKCVSSYPADPQDMNIRTIADMRKKFKLPVGLSDHTLGMGVAIAAVSLEANMVEKHFTLSRKLKTPDNFFSLEPEELRALVENIRIVEKALGRVRYSLTEKEKQSLVFRRSLFVVKDVEEGEVFTADNIRSIRPNYGIKPKHLKEIIGRRSRKEMKRGTPLQWEMIE